MKAALFALLAVLACVATLQVVCAQNIVVPAPAPVLDPQTGLPVQTTEPAIIGKPRRGLKKPIIFNPTPASPNAVDPSEPLIGKPPANLKKSAVSEHIYGGGVEYEVGREVTGCPCKRAVPEKYRYDAKFKRERPVLPACPCALLQPQPKPEDALPPVIARIRREPKPLQLNYTLPCNGTHTLLPNGTLIALGPQQAPVEKVAPEYYRFPRDLAERIQARFNATVGSLPCLNCAKLHAAVQAAQQPQTITPKFYPTLAQRRERRRARRAAAREAARKAAAAAATKKF